MSSMSTEQPLDPHLIEQTKQQIRSLYAEIAQLARSDIGPDQFYSEMLPRVISALAAVGGVVWAKQEQGPLALQYQVNLQESRLAEKGQEEQMRHGRLIQKVMSTGEGILVPPNSGAGDSSDQAGNPTEWLLVLGPLKTELEVVGVVEVFQRPEAGAAIQRGYLRFLTEVCSLASEFLNSRQLRHFSDRQTLWTQLEEFTRLVHSSLNPRDTAYTIANEGRRLIECDRVSVAIRKGQKCLIEAVSGQDMVDKRSNTVRLLGKLATVVVASEEPMWYSGDTTDMAPQVEEAVQEYVDESHTKMIAVLPLVRPEAAEKEKENPDDPDDSPEPIGALIVEQIEDSRVPQRMLSRVDVVAQHSSAAMANSLEHENVFLMPVWRTLGKSRWIVRGRNLPKAVLAAVAVLVLLVGMAVVPADFRLASKGTLEPVQRRDVFAGIDGVVSEVKVEHGDLVKSGDLLAVLRNYRLSEEVETLKGNIATTLEQMERLQRQLTLNRQLPPEEYTRLSGELLEQKAKLESLRSQRRIYAEQEKELQVKSPADGTILTWDLQNRLLQRPVQRGQVLMRVADPSGPWQLELQMSEDRMGFIVRAQNELRIKVRDRLREVLREQMRDKVRDKLRSELAVQMDAASPAPSPGVATPELGGSEESVVPPGSNNSSAAPPKPEAAPSKPEETVPSKPSDTVPPAPPAGPKTSESSSTFRWMAGEMNSSTSRSESIEQPSSILWPGKPAQKTDAKPVGQAAPAESEPPPPSPMPATKPDNRDDGAQPPSAAPDLPAQPFSAMPQEGKKDGEPSSPEATGQSPAAPESQPSPAESPTESAAPVPASQGDLDQRVDKELTARLDQEVEAELAKVPANRLAEKLREVSGEEMEDRLKVSYILATDPGTTHYGYVEDMHLAAEVRGEEGNTVLIKVAIDKNDLRDEHVRPGASVTAKVECGRRSIGYVWFHDLIAFFRKTWFRWF